VGIGSRLAAQALVSSSRLTGSRSSGPKRSASAGKLGGFPRSRHSIPTALHRSRSHAEEPRKIDLPAEGEAWLHPPQVFSIDQQFRNLVRCFKVLSQNTANRLPIDGFPPLDTLSSFQLVRRSMRDVGEGDFSTFWGHHHALPSVQRSQWNRNLFDAPHATRASRAFPTPRSVPPGTAHAQRCALVSHTRDGLEETTRQAAFAPDRLSFAPSHPRPEPAPTHSAATSSTMDGTAP